MEENYNSKKKGMITILGLFIFSLLFAIFITNGNSVKAIDMNYEDFALLKIDGSKTTLEVENAKNFDSPTSPTYIVNNYKYIKDNKLVFVMKFNFSCQGIAEDLSDGSIVKKFGKDWQATILETMISNGLNVQGDKESGYKINSDIYTIISSYSLSDWNKIIITSFPQKADIIDSRVQQVMIANLKATFSMMVNEENYVKIENLPSSEEKLFYYCASSSDTSTITYENGIYSFKDYEKYPTVYDKKSGFISSYLHLFSSYNLNISAKLDDNNLVDTDGDGKNDTSFISFIFPAYYDYAQMEKDGKLGSNDEKYLVDAGNRTQALFCEDWAEGQLRLEQGDSKYYGYCKNNKYTFLKNETGFEWTIKKEIDLSSEISNYNGKEYKLSDGPHSINLKFSMEQEIVNFGFTFGENDSFDTSVSLQNIDTILQSFNSQLSDNYANFSSVATSYFINTMIGKVNYLSIQGGTNDEYLEYLDQIYSLLDAANDASMNGIEKFMSFLGTCWEINIKIYKKGIEFLKEIFTGQKAEKDETKEKLTKIYCLLGLEGCDISISATLSNAPARVNASFSLVYTTLFEEIKNKCLTGSASIEGCLMTYDEFKNFVSSTATDYANMWEESANEAKTTLHLKAINTLAKIWYLISGDPVGKALTVTSIIKNGGIKKAFEFEGINYHIYLGAVKIFQLVSNDESLINLIAGPVYQMYVETMLFGYNSDEYKEMSNVDVKGEVLLNSNLEEFLIKKIETWFNGLVNSYAIPIAKVVNYFETNYINFKACLNNKIKDLTSTPLEELVKGVFEKKYPFSYIFNDCSNGIVTFNNLLKSGIITLKQEILKHLTNSNELQNETNDIRNSVQVYNYTQLYEFYEDWVLSSYSTYYNPDTGEEVNRTDADLYSYFIKALKSKYVNASYTTFSEDINIIIDRSSPDDITLDDSKNFDKELIDNVEQKDTTCFSNIYKKIPSSDIESGKTNVDNYYIFEDGQYIIAKGIAKAGVTYYKYERNNYCSDNSNNFVYQYNRVYTNEKYEFSVNSSKYGDSLINYNTSRYIVGSGIDHYDYIILKNDDKLMKETLLKALKIYGSAKYISVSVVEGTELDSGFYIKSEAGYVSVEEGTKAESGVTYYKEVNPNNKLAELLKSLNNGSGISNDANILNLIEVLTSIDDYNLYNILWTSLKVGDSISIEEDGQYVILVRAVDFVGNRGPVSYKEVLIDKTAPEISLEFFDVDNKSIVATNDQYKNIISGASDNNYVVSDDVIGHINISLIESGNFASGLSLESKKLKDFNVCAADILENPEGCLSLNGEFMMMNVEKEGYYSAKNNENLSSNNVWFKTFITDENGLILKMELDETKATIYRIAFEISDYAGNTTIVRILVVSNMENLDIESDISTTIVYDLASANNQIKSWNISLLYPTYVIADLVYNNEATSNEIKGNYFDLNDSKIMSYTYFVVGKTDRDKFYDFDKNSSCDLSTNPNNIACNRDNKQLADRFLQDTASSDLVKLISSITNLNEDYFIFQKFELRISGSTKDYTHIIMREFEYSLEDLMKQISFTVNDYGHEVGNIVADSTYEILSSENYEMRIKFIDYSKSKNNFTYSYGCYNDVNGQLKCDNLITKISYSFDLYRPVVNNSSSTKVTISQEFDTHSSFKLYNSNKHSEVSFTENYYKQFKDEDGNITSTEYYIYINLKEFAEEYKYIPTFTINNFVVNATKSMKNSHTDSSGNDISALNSTYYLLSEDGIGFYIYTNYLTEEYKNETPNLGVFEYDESMNIQIYERVKWTNQSNLIFHIDNGSATAALDHVFDLSLIYQYAVFKNDLTTDYAIALIADYYSIDLLEEMFDENTICDDSRCKEYLLNQRLALIKEYLNNLSKTEYNQLNRYLMNNGKSLKDVNMSILKELDMYSIEYQTIIADYIYNLDKKNGMYFYLTNGKQTPRDRLKYTLPEEVPYDKLFITAYQIYANKIGWNKVEFDAENKSTGVIDASSFVTDTNNKSYIIIYRAIDALGRVSMDYEELTYFQEVPNITISEVQTMDLEDGIFKGFLSKTTLSSYLEDRLDRYFDENQDYYKMISKSTIKYCIVSNTECLEITNDLIKEYVYVGNVFQVVFSMTDYAGNNLSIPVSYNVIYNKAPNIEVSSSDEYAKELDIKVKINYTSIGGVDIKSIEMSYCGAVCEAANEYIDLENKKYGKTDVNNLTNEELAALFELMSSISGNIELHIDANKRDATTASPVQVNGFYLVKVVTTNVSGNEETPYIELTNTYYSSVFVMNNIDNIAPDVLLGGEERINDNEFTSLLPDNSGDTTENYYFKNSSIYLFVKDRQVGISESDPNAVMLVKKVSKECAFDPESDEEITCFENEIASGSGISSTRVNGVWKFDLSPSKERMGKTTYYLKAKDALGNVVYKRIDIQVDTLAPSIDKDRTKINDSYISNDLYVEKPELLIDFAANANVSEGYQVASPLHKIEIYENSTIDNPTIRYCADYNNCNGVIKLDYNLAMTYDSSGSYYQQGMKTIFIKLYDAAGNASEVYSIDVHLDTVPPNISVTLSADSQINNIGQSVKVNVTDNSSTIYQGSFASGGVTYYGIAYQKEGENKWYEVTSNMTILLTENGTYVFRAYDYALNYNETSIVIDNIDKEAPKVTFSTNGNTKALPSHSLTVQVEDDLSNIKTIKYCWLKSGEVNCSEYEYANNLSASNLKFYEVSINKSVTKVIENGDYSFAIYVEDIWGNNSFYTTKPFSFDCKKPNIIPDITLNYNKCAFDTTSSDCFNSETEMYEFLIELTDTKNILLLELSETAKVYISGYSTTDISGVYVNYDTETGTFTTENANKINYYDASVGTYYLRYSVEYKDVNDNNQVEYAFVKIVIKDVAAPIITIRGEEVLTYTVKTISTYEDEGVNVSDVHDGNVAMKPEWKKCYFTPDNKEFSTQLNEVSSINPNVVGTYYIVYNAYDNSGNHAYKIRTVKFVDDVAPVISFEKGNIIDNYLLGSDFDYLKGITIKDNYDGVIVEDYVEGESETASTFTKLVISYYVFSNDTKKYEPQNTLVFTKQVGQHKYTYRFTDINGNEGTLERFIIVKDVLATMKTENGDITFDLTTNREEIVDGEVSIDPNGLNLKVNGVSYSETTILNKVGKHEINVSDNYGNTVTYSIYMDTSTKGDSKTVLVDKTKVNVEKTIIKSTDTFIKSSSGDIYTLSLSEELSSEGSLAKYVNNPDYVVVVAIFCNDINDTNGIACSSNYLELSVLENITGDEGGSVVSMSSISDAINFSSSDMKAISNSTTGGKVALLVMRAEESETIAQAYVEPVKNTSKTVSLALLIGIPAILGLYVLIRIVKFKKAIKTM